MLVDYHSLANNNIQTTANFIDKFDSEASSSNAEVSGDQTPAGPHDASVITNQKAFLDPPISNCSPQLPNVIAMPMQLSPDVSNTANQPPML